MGKSQGDQAKFCYLSIPTAAPPSLLFFSDLLGMEHNTVFMKWPLASYGVARMTQEAVFSSCLSNWPMTVYPI